MKEQLIIECGRADKGGRRFVVAKYGELFHRDRFDTDSAFHRKKFRDAAIHELKLPTNVQAVIESQVLAAAEEQDALAEAAGYGAPELTRLADVTPRKVNWLWQGRIAIGKLTLLAGDPGLGKSFISCDVAARVSTGTPWPDTPHEPQPVGGVVMLSAEDDLADTIRPRLDAHGADVERIVALEGIAVRDVGGDRRRGVDLTVDLPALESAIDQVSFCRLVIVDPVSAYLGRTDSHNNAEVRGVLERLADLAERRRVAVLAVTHLRKGEGPAMYRAMGSLAFIAAARAAWVVCPDPKDRRRRLLLPIKNNLASDCGGLAYEIGGFTGSSPVVAWSADPVTVTADEALASENKRGPSGEAVKEAGEWLRTFLASGAKPQPDVQETAKANGISHGTLRRAFKAIGAKAVKDGFQGPWQWTLSDQGKDAQPSLSQETCAPLEEPAHLWKKAVECKGSQAPATGQFAKDAQVSDTEALDDKLAQEADFLRASF